MGATAHALFGAFTTGHTLGHTCLQLGRAAQRIYRTAKLNEDAVTRGFDQPAVMFGNLRVEQFGPYRLEALGE
jgi:hypothetical protein